MLEKNGAFVSKLPCDMKTGKFCRAAKAVGGLGGYDHTKKD